MLQMSTFYGMWTPFFLLHEESTYFASVQVGQPARPGSNLYGRREMPSLPLGNEGFFVGELEAISNSLVGASLLAIAFFQSP